MADEGVGFVALGAIFTVTGLLLQQMLPCGKETQSCENYFGIEQAYQNPKTPVKSTLVIDRTIEH